MSYFCSFPKGDVLFVALLLQEPLYSSLKILLFRFGLINKNLKYKTTIYL